MVDGRPSLTASHHAGFQALPRKINRGQLATMPAQTSMLFGAMSAVLMVVAVGQPASAQDKAKIAAGEGLYNDYCYTCHGERLVSSGQTFDLRRLTANDRPRFDNSVLAGKGQMPPWKGVL